VRAHLEEASEAAQYIILQPGSATQMSGGGAQVIQQIGAIVVHWTSSATAGAQANAGVGILDCCDSGPPAEKIFGVGP